MKAISIFIRVWGVLIALILTNGSSSGSAQLIYNRAIVDLAWEPGSGVLYGSRGLSGPVVQLNPVTGSEMARIATGADALAFSADGMELWIADQINDSAVVVDIDPGSPTFNQVVATVTGLPNQPVTIVCTDRGTAYLACNGGNAVVAIDMATRAVIETIPGTGFAQVLSLSGDHKRAYLGSAGRIYVINTDPVSPDFNTVAANYRLSYPSVRGVIGREGGNALYVFGSDEIARKFLLDGSGPARTFPTIAPNFAGASEGAAGELLFLGAPATGSTEREVWPLDLTTDLVGAREALPTGSVSGVVGGAAGTAFAYGGAGVVRVQYEALATAAPTVPATVNVAGTAGSNLFAVTATAGTHWQVFPSEEWISVESPFPLGNGDGEVRIAVTQNTGEGARTGTVFVGNQPVEIVQARGPDFIGLSESSLSMGAGGSGAFFQVEANVAWIVTGLPDWIELKSPLSNVGGAVVNLRIAHNPTSSARSAQIDIGGETLQVNQDAGPFVLTQSPSGGSGGPGIGTHEVTIAGQPAVIIVGEGYDASRPTYLCYYLHGDEGGYRAHSSPTNQVHQFIDANNWIYVAPQAPEAPARPGIFPWDGRSGGSQTGNVEQVTAVLDHMFENYNVYRDVLFGSGASGGSWFQDAVFFPREGSNYPSFFLLGCGAAGMSEGYFTYRSAQSVSADPEAVVRSELKYAIGTEDFLFSNATVSAPTYASLGFSVQTDFMEGVGHCTFDLSTKIADYWGEKLAQVNSMIQPIQATGLTVRIDPVSGEVTIRWPVKAGFTYTLQHSDDLARWQTLGLPKSYAEPGSASERHEAIQAGAYHYYRVLENP